MSAYIYSLHVKLSHVCPILRNRTDGNTLNCAGPCNARHLFSDEPCKALVTEAINAIHGTSANLSSLMTVTSITLHSAHDSQQLRVMSLLQLAEHARTDLANSSLRQANLLSHLWTTELIIEMTKEGKCLSCKPL